MNYSFRGAFNYGFKMNFSKSAGNFSKSFFKNKNNVNFLNSQSNSGKYFQVNFGNKYFMNKILAITQNIAILGAITSARIVSGAVALSENEIDTEIGNSAAEATEALVMIGEVCLIREDCKWTCSTRLAGPQTPVTVAIN